MVESASADGSTMGVLQSGEPESEAGRGVLQVQAVEMISRESYE
jgi:hypothetical protein